ncbi:hypothetical protein BH23ACT11_BH23ACT11_22550 [soil metagenome]
MPDKNPLVTEQGNTVIEAPVVSQIVGVAAQEVQGAQMGGAGSRAVSGLLERAGAPAQTTRGVTVEVGDADTAINLNMAVEYGKSVPQLSESVRRNIINRVENLTGLRVTEVNITVNDVMLPDQQS